MKKAFGILCVAVVVIAIIGVWSHKYSLVNQVREHLTQTGYQTSDIARIDGKVGKLPIFSVEVVFSDEPNVRYFYREKNGSILQYSHSLSHINGTKYKHVEFPK